MLECLYGTGTSGSRFEPPAEAPKRVLKRNATWWLSRANVVEAQGESRGPDTAQNCSPYGHLLIAAELLICDGVD